MHSPKNYPLISFLDRRGSNADKWMQAASTDVRGELDYLGAWIADTEFAPPLAVTEAIIASSSGSLGYHKAPSSLLTVMCEYLNARYGQLATSEQIILLDNLSIGLRAVSCLLAKRDNGKSEVLGSVPIYPVFRKAPGDFKLTLHECSVFELDASGNWQFKIERFAEKINEKCGLIYLCNPNNPNGYVFSKDDLQAIGNLAIEYDLLICSDEVHADIVYSDAIAFTPFAVACPQAQARLITLSGPSKAYAVQGLNIAFAHISDRDLRNEFHQVIGRWGLGSHVSVLAMAAFAAAWSEKSAEWMSQVRGFLQSQRDILMQEIGQMKKITMPNLHSTYLAWLDFSGFGCASAEQLNQLLLKYQLKLSPGLNFSSEALDNKFMRLNFACSPEQLGQLIERLHLIESEL